MFTLSDQHAMIVYLRCTQCFLHAGRILSDNENLSLTEEKLNLTRSIQPLRLKHLGQTKRILNMWLDKHFKSLPALLDADLSSGGRCEQDYQVPSGAQMGSWSQVCEVPSSPYLFPKPTTRDKDQGWFLSNLALIL